MYAGIMASFLYFRMQVSFLYQLRLGLLKQVDTVVTDPSIPTWQSILFPTGPTRSNFTVVQLDSRRLFLGFGSFNGIAAPSNHIITTSELTGEIQGKAD